MGNKTLEELREEYINKFTEIVDVEGCEAFSDICNKKDDNGQFICEYCRRWGGQQREKLRFSGNIDDVWQFIEEAIKEEREEGYREAIRKKNANRTKRFGERYKTDEEFRKRRRATSLKSYYKRKHIKN